MYDPATGTWTTTGALNTGRYNHTATLLPNGQVLVTGGQGSSGNILASVEMYDPATGTWTTTGALNTGRYYHTATLLPNGKVMVTGGNGSYGISSILASAELYDPATGSWTTTGSLNTARQWHTATLLTNGKILVTGGQSSSGSTLASAELFDTGLGFSSAWQPQISTATSPLVFSNSLALTGSGFRGLAEGSGGNTQDSSADYPVVQLRRLDNEQTVYLNPTNWGTNAYTSTAVTNQQTGWALVTVFVNGIPSPASLVNFGTLPQILTQPTNQAVAAGSNAAFTVTATGVATLGYQWVENLGSLGGNLTGATSNTLVLTNVSVLNPGYYQVVVTNPYGGVTSSVVTLTVSNLPFAILTTNSFSGLGYNNGQFGFNLTGPAGSNAVIYASTNLQTWTPLVTNQMTLGALVFNDAQATNYPQRFYRAKLGP